MCGSALPTEIVFLSTSSEITLFYHESADVEDEPTSFNLTFTYVAVRRNGNDHLKLSETLSVFAVIPLVKRVHVITPCMRVIRKIRCNNVSFNKTEIGIFRIEFKFLCNALANKSVDLKRHFLNLNSCVD